MRVTLLDYGMIVRVQGLKLRPSEGEVEGQARAGDEQRWELPLPTPRLATASSDCLASGREK